MALSDETPKLGFDDLEQFRIPQDFQTAQALVDYAVIPLRKPRPQHWFRVHPDIKLESFPFLEVERENGAPELFIVRGDLIPSLADLSGITCRALRLCVCRPRNTPFVWPIKLPTDAGSKLGDWGRSALARAKTAETQWVRIKSDTHLGDTRRTQPHRSRSVNCSQPSTRGVAVIN